MTFSEGLSLAYKFGVVALISLSYAAAGCGDEQDSDDTSASGGSGGGGTTGDPCIEYCNAYTAQCSDTIDCTAYCTTTLQQANPTCLAELAAYHACARTGPFQCAVALGLSPTNCGLADYAACEQTAQPSCSRATTFDTVCSTRGEGLIGYFCTVAEAPAGCIPTNPDNMAAMQSMCCPP
jgi:hypothetical protein